MSISNLLKRCSQISLCLLLIFSASNGYSLAEKKHVFIVDSYNVETFEWTKQIREGILKGFKAGGMLEGVNLEVHEATLDAYVNKTEKTKDEMAQKIIKKINNNNEVV